jgi:CRP/FNR family transcriptional regulator
MPDVVRVAGHARVQRVQDGEAVVRRGGRLPGLCVLISGALKFALPVPERGERVLGLVSGCGTFGEAAALLRRPSSLDVVALADSALLVLPLSAVESLAAATPRFARNLLELLAGRTLELQAELEAGVLQRAPQRLAAYLASLAPAGAAQEPATFELPVSKTLLAAILGIKKETLSRLLRDLVERGVIAVSRRRVTVIDRGRLGETR